MTCRTRRRPWSSRPAPLCTASPSWAAWWPAGAAVFTVAVGFAFASVFHDIAPRTHWFKTDLPYQEAQAKQKGPLPTDSGLKGTVTIGEPSIRSHWESLKAGIHTVVHHPQGYGLGNSGTTAQRFDGPSPIMRCRAAMPNTISASITIQFHGPPITPG